MRYKIIFIDKKTTQYLSDDISKTQNSKICSIESTLQLKVVGQFRFSF